MSPDNDTQLLAIGKQCSHPSCLLVDFLPFKCQHCEDLFCQEHFKVAAHKCPKYDESKYNRVAPDCPLCNTPVAVRPGQDPNDRMEDHFTNECSVMTGKSGRARTMPVCARGNCRKVLFSPIRCDKCRSQFCPAHRFPADHNCAAPAPSSGSKSSVSNPLSGVNTKNLNVKVSAASAAAVSAIKKATASASASAPASKPAPVARIAPSKPAIPSSHTNNPFSKTDRPFSSLRAVPPINDLSRDSSTTSTDTTNTKPAPDNTNTVSIPVTHIDYNAFVPPPIFACA